MSGCSNCSPSGQETGSCFSESGKSEIEELVKAESITEASKLIREGHILMAVYWNSDRSSEEYILGKMKKKEAPVRRVGFSVR